MGSTEKIKNEFLKVFLTSYLFDVRFLINVVINNYDLC